MAIQFSVEGVAREIAIVRRKPRLVLRIGGRDYEVEEEAIGAPRGRMRVDGRSVDVFAARDAEAAFVHLHGRHWRIAAIDSRGQASAAHGGADIRAPMPGVVVALNKSEGEAVVRGETILTIESMKLQMALAAPRDGIVAKLLRKAGETFDKDEIVARLVEDGAQ